MKKNEREVHIRQAHADDLKKVAELYRLWEEEGNIRGLVADTARSLRKYLGDFFWVAESGEAGILGFAYGSKNTSDRNCRAVFDLDTPYLEVENIYVLPGWRSRDIGSKLMEKLLGAAGECGIDRAVVFSSAVDWERVVSFYSRQGFKMWFFQMFK